MVARGEARMARKAKAAEEGNALRAGKKAAAGKESWCRPPSNPFIGCAETGCGRIFFGRAVSNRGTCFLRNRGPEI